MPILKIFDARNVTLTNASMYFETGDPNFLFPVIGRKFETAFLEQFGQMFSKQDLKKVDDNDVARTYFYNRGYNLFPALYHAIKLNAQLPYSDKTEAALIRLFADYKDLMDKDIKSMDDVEQLMEKAKFFQRKYLLMKENENTPDEEKRFDLETLIFSVETTLQMQVDRKLKLFQFVPYFLNAVNIASKRNNENH